MLRKFSWMALCCAVQPSMVKVLRGRPSPDAPGDGHYGPVLSVTAHPTLPLLASAGYEGDAVVRVWQLQEGSE